MPLNGPVQFLVFVQRSIAALHLANMADDEIELLDEVVAALDELAGSAQQLTDGVIRHAFERRSLVAS